MRETTVADERNSGKGDRHGERIFKIGHLTLDNSLPRFASIVERFAKLGFDRLCVGGLFASVDGLPVIADHSLAKDGTPVLDRVESLAEICRKAGLSLGIDLVLDRIALTGPTAEALAGAYGPAAALNSLDPRVPSLALSTAHMMPAGASRAAGWWATKMADLAEAGATSFRLVGLPGLPPGFLKLLDQAVRAIGKPCERIAWAADLPWTSHEELEGAGLAAITASTCWWDGRAPWYAQQIESLERFAPTVGIAVPPDAEGVPDQRDAGQNALLAAATTNGLFVCADHASNGEDARLASAASLVDRLAARGLGNPRMLSGPSEPVTRLLRAETDVRTARSGVLVALNAGPTPAGMPPSAPLPPSSGGAFVLNGELPDTLAPGDSTVADVISTEPVRSPKTGKAADRRAARQAARQTPIVIENVVPSVPTQSGAGTFAAKHIVGRVLTIEADIFGDGHDVLAAEVLWWSDDNDERTAVELTSLPNDRWQASLTPDRIGRHFFAVEAWRDEFGSMAHGVEVKHRAGLDVSVEIEEAALYLQELGDADLKALAKQLRKMPGDEAVRQIVSPETRAKVATKADRGLKATLGPFPIEVERPQAEFAAWYELFPRSLTDDPARHGTLDDVIAALPRVQAMGFDVLYFPPIHPIGRAKRKGRNNSLTAGPDDVGSPYAIGAEEGGHDALHPALGTPADFRRLVAAAREHGLELALDFAIQCSLDHPWLREHPDWFRHRPDGSIKHAENPPKKYEDIVNVDFYASGSVPGLWLALRDIVLHWIEEGVRIFRVDNPHTKPLSFWQWMIGDVRGRHPDVMFLSEAFTRPKMMYRLAAVGFSQSYTYFTWRNHKREISDYLEELSSRPAVDYFRPHFFVNTPDINPYFLQSSGRPGFLIRAALAATLSGLWGVYSGFELCEAAALPGREEYLDSEKYEIRVRDFAAPGNIVGEITLLNRLRRAHPALQSHRDITFYNAFNDNVLLYGKRLPDAADMILVAVSLDPHNVQEADFEMPLWEWKLPDHGALQVEDLVHSGRGMWHGKNQRLRLDPNALPFAIWRLSPEGTP